MKVLLMEDIKKLGWLGDVVEVSDGYARNYLLPEGLAKMPTADNIKAIAAQKEARTQQRKQKREKLEQLAEAVAGAEAVIAAKANEQGHLFGSVGKKQIAGNLCEQGFDIVEEFVDLQENIKQVGTTAVSLRFDPDLAVEVKVTIVPEPQEETLKEQ